MEEIICMQKNAPKPVTVRRFVMGAAGIVLRLAVAQIAVNAAIALTGVGLLNVLFYVYAVTLIVLFMRATVAGSVYVLKEKTLVLQSLLGDSTSAVVEIPLVRVVSLRPVKRGENLRLHCAQVTTVDPALRPGWRCSLAFAASLLSGRLARLIAGKAADEQVGWVLCFTELRHLRACVFRPDEQMLKALEHILPDAFEADERLHGERLRSIYARSLQRAFPLLYPHVVPLVSEADVAWAVKEKHRRRRKRAREREEKRHIAQVQANAKRKKREKKRPEAMMTGTTQETGEETHAHDEVHDDSV